MGQLSKALLANGLPIPAKTQEQRPLARREFNPQAPAFVSTTLSVRPSFKESMDRQANGVLGSYCPGAEFLACIREVGFMGPGNINAVDSQPVDSRSQPVDVQNAEPDSPPPSGRNWPQSGPNRAPDFAESTLKAQLQALQRESPDSVFIARGINKLGFESADILTAHFSQYGDVKGAYVSHSRVKSLRKVYGEIPSTEAYWRLRAAGLGFVVMKSSQATARILAEGSEHYVNGIKIRLKPFQVHADAKDNEGENSDTSGSSRLTH